MAKPIKETPVLYGKDAERFLKTADEMQKSKKNISEREKVMKIFSQVNANSSKHSLI